MSQPADLPFATISYSVGAKGRDIRCEVLVAGEAVALLPASGVEATHECSRGARMKLLLLTESVDIGSVVPHV